MNLPKTGDIVTLEHYGTGKVLWIEGRSFKVKLEKEVNVVPSKNWYKGNISCYISDLLSIVQSAEPDFDNIPEMRSGSIVYHRKFGKGTVRELTNSNGAGNRLERDKAVVDFGFPHGRKTLILTYAQLQVITY